MKQGLIWDYYQNEAPEFFAGSSARLRYLAKRVKSRGKVLNIGVGAGIFEELAIQRGLDVYSLDPDEKAIASLRQRLGMKEKAKVGFSQKIPFPDESFDAVVISEVIEHLSVDIIGKTMREISRVLFFGGRIIGTVPARENLKDQLVVCPHCGEHFHRWGHIQSFDAERINALISLYFRIEEVSEHLFFNWSAMNWKGKVHGLITMLLYYVGVHGSNESILFVATKPCE
ncbi:MAG: hypothetical protein BA861_00205 [Desulfobacterales bacterium S3730MH5]|nr:MAG: hypothetical protein BA861_00205 [Desulfobacterales bacterium S3730MH5]